MAKQDVTADIAAILESEAAAAEAGRDEPIPESAKISRGDGRSKILQVRLNPEELAELRQLAATRGIPPSTLARGAIMGLIRPDVARSEAASRLVDDFARYVASLE